MYRLQVFYPATHRAGDVKFVSSATKVLTLIPEMLKEHHGCERIEVSLDEALLFSVDCKGNRIEP